MKGYATRRVAQILSLSDSQVRSSVRAGFLRPERGPRGHFRFSFPDLVFPRTARGLVEANIPHRRIRRALSKLRQDLPESGRLIDLRIAAEGGRIVVADGTTRPQDADAHFNAANLCERLREMAAALRHWKSYRKLTSDRR